MTALSLSHLKPPVRDRLEALAEEWFGVSPWECYDRDGSRIEDWRDDGRPRDPVLPIQLGAGFDLGIRLAADRVTASPAGFHIDADHMRAVVNNDEDEYPCRGIFPDARGDRYDAIPAGVERLAAILLELE